MRFFKIGRLLLPLLLISSLFVGGVHAAWSYATGTDINSENEIDHANDFVWEQPGIYITDVKVKSGTVNMLTHNEERTFSLRNLQLLQGSTSSYTTTTYESNSTKTTVNNSTYVSTVRTVSGSGLRKTISTTNISPVTVTVTVKNNTNDRYKHYFQGVEESGTYTNGLIAYSAAVSGYAPSDTAREGYFTDNETMDIDVTFYLSASNTYAVNSANFSLLLQNAALDVLFGLDPADVEDMVISGAMDRFQTMLNSPELYEQLTTAIIDNYDGGTYNDNRFWTGTYIGNVDGSNDEDSAIIRELFGSETIKQVIEGTEQTITLIIKWENIDGNEATGTDFSLTSDRGVTQNYRGCELTLYMTTEDLINDWNYNSYAQVVYATVYTCGSYEDASGNTQYTDWYRLGETYSGKAQVVGYVGGEKNGSFNTGEWYSILPYHGATTGSTLATIIKKYIQSLE